MPESNDVNWSKVWESNLALSSFRGGSFRPIMTKLDLTPPMAFCLWRNPLPASIWSGSISFGLVSIPVRLAVATEKKDLAFHLAFHLLHR